MPPGRNAELARGWRAVPAVNHGNLRVPGEETSGGRVPLVGSRGTAAPCFRPVGDNAEGPRHRPREPLTHAQRTRGQFSKDKLPWAGSCSQRRTLGKAP